MKHTVTASGAVVFRREGGGLLFLVIYSGRNRLWGFPKGHVEPGEGEREAAVREIAEETGLTDLRFIDGFLEEDIYRITGSRPPFQGKPVEKHAKYFLCETGESRVRVDNDEITDYRWPSCEEVLPLLKFEGGKRILLAARDFLGRAP